MLIDKRLRYPKEQVLIPVASRALSRIHPITITVAAFGVGLVAAFAAWQGAYGMSLGLWALNRILDGLDGTVARLYNKQTDFGGYLDIVLDHVVYAVVPLGLALSLNTAPVYLGLALLLASFYINGASWMYSAALLEKRKLGASTQGEMTTVTMPTGLIEGAETIFFYCLFLLLPNYLVPLFALMALLVMATATQRLVWAARNF